MIDYSYLLSELNNTRLRPWVESLPEQIKTGLSHQRYGDLHQWYDALAKLPAIAANKIHLTDEVVIGHADEIAGAAKLNIENCFRQLIPWRKGPYSVFGINIDTEWRSDWKWDRVLPHISSLNEKNILDVGCGNGYHCLRMLGQGARRVIGIDPSPRFVVQFYMLKHFIGTVAVDVLPVGIESMPPNLEYFDTTFSMGVLYHRRSPMDHLRELKETLKPGGELVLETLIIEGDIHQVFVPEGRYAKMNNVWFIPSAASLLSWLNKCGFVDARCVDINQTSINEQRVTNWMEYQSLQDFLDPNDHNKTVEGHPAPRRGIFVARKPV